MSDYEKNCYRALGQILSHALEATGRTLRIGDTEREVAGQLAHRLLHRGALPVTITVAADGRSRSYRHGSFTATKIRNYCVLKVAARKYGLCAMASRSVCFDEPDAVLPQGARPGLQDQRDLRRQHLARLRAAADPDVGSADLPDARHRARVVPGPAGTSDGSGRGRGGAHAAARGAACTRTPPSPGTRASARP